MLRLSVIALLCLTIAGCGGGGGTSGGNGEDPDPPTLPHWATGHWLGPVMTTPDPVILDITITANGSFGGFWLHPFEDTHYVLGTIDAAGNMSLTLDPSSPTPRYFAAVYTYDTAEVKLNSTNFHEVGHEAVTWQSWLNFQ